MTLSLRLSLRPVIWATATRWLVGRAARASKTLWHPFWSVPGSLCMWAKFAFAS
jgi:hypothetical protein